MTSYEMSKTHQIHDFQVRNIQIHLVSFHIFLPWYTLVQRFQHKSGLVWREHSVAAWSTAYLIVCKLSSHAILCVVSSVYWFVYRFLPFLIGVLFPLQRWKKSRHCSWDRNGRQAVKWKWVDQVVWNAWKCAVSDMDRVLVNKATSEKRFKNLQSMIVTWTLANREACCLSHEAFLWFLLLQMPQVRDLIKQAARNSRGKFFDIDFLQHLRVEKPAFQTRSK